MIPPLSPFMHGLLVGIEAMEFHLSVLAPEEYRNNSLYLEQFNRGVVMGYRWNEILNG